MLGWYYMIELGGVQYGKYIIRLIFETFDFWGGIWWFIPNILHHDIEKEIVRRLKYIMRDRRC